MIKINKRLFLQSGILFTRIESNQLHKCLANRNYSSSSYEGDGKTKVKILNNDPEMGLMVNSFSEVTFNNFF